MGYDNLYIVQHGQTMLNNYNSSDNREDVCRALISIATKLHEADIANSEK